MEKWVPWREREGEGEGERKWGKGEGERRGGKERGRGTGRKSSSEPINFLACLDWLKSPHVSTITRIHLRYLSLSVCVYVCVCQN